MDPRNDQASETTFYSMSTAMHFDGSAIMSTESAGGGRYTLVRRKAGSPDVTLITDEETGKLSWNSFGDPGICAARDAGLAAIYGMTEDRKHAAIWLVNTKTGKANRFVYGDFVEPSALENIYVSAQLSPDGKWLAYRDFTVQNKVVVVPADMP